MIPMAKDGTLLGNIRHRTPVLTLDVAIFLLFFFIEEAQIRNAWNICARWRQWRKLKNRQTNMFCFQIIYLCLWNKKIFFILKFFIFRYRFSGKKRKSLVVPCCGNSRYYEKKCWNIECRSSHFVFGRKLQGEKHFTMKIPVNQLNRW